MKALKFKQKLQFLVVWILAGLTFTSCDRGHEEELATGIEHYDVSENEQKSSQPGFSVKNSIREQSVEESALNVLLMQVKLSWSRTMLIPNEQLRLTLQKDTQKRALALGPSEQMEEFVEFALDGFERDARVRFIAEMGNALFDAGEQEALLSWIAKLRNPEMRTIMSRIAGHKLNATEEKAKGVLESLAPDSDTQREFLVGYCISIIESDAEKAVKTYFDLRPKNVTFSGLDQVVKLLPETTDFLTVARLLPSDSKEVAKRVRASLLAAWCRKSPIEAAEYVLDTPDIVNPDHLKSIVDSWAKISPEDAVNWCTSTAPPGLPRDHGMRGLAGHFTVSDPARAFSFATQVGDFDLKVKTATEVFEVWEKTDRAAAEAAWLKAFPGG